MGCMKPHWDKDDWWLLGLLWPMKTGKIGMMWLVLIVSKADWSGEAVAVWGGDRLSCQGQAELVFTAADGSGAWEGQFYHAKLISVYPLCTDVCVCVWLTSPLHPHQLWIMILIFFNFYFLVFFVFSGAASVAYGGSQARGLIESVATSLHQSHSNSGSKPRLPPTPPLTATLDP